MSTALTLKQQLEADATLPEKFTKLIAAVHKVSPDEAKSIYEAELFSFLKETSEKNLTDVSQLSAKGVFLDVCRNGLSFSSASKHVYIMSRSVKVGDAWEKRMYWDTTQDGKIFQCYRAGSVEYVSKPVIVYDCDKFTYDGTSVTFEKTFPRPAGAKIVAGFVYLTLPRGAREVFVMDMEDVARLQGYSAKQNKGAANALYTSYNGGIDPGFFGSKLIKGALKNMRKSGERSEFYMEDEGSDVQAPPTDAPVPPVNNNPEPTQTNSNEQPF